MEIHGGRHGEDNFFRFTKSSIKHLFNLDKCKIIRSEYIGSFGTALNILISGFIIRDYQFARSWIQKIA